MKIRVFIALLLLVSYTALGQLREIRHLQQYLPHVKDNTTKIDVLNRLAQLFTGVNPDSSYFYLIAAKNMAEKSGYKKGTAIAYKSYGALLIGENNYLAATYLSNSLDIFRAIDDKEGESMTLMNMGNLMVADKDIANALKYFEQSYQVGLTQTKDSTLSIIMNNINLHSADYFSPKVDSMYRRGRAIAYKYHDDRMILYFRLFDIYRQYDKGNKPQAMHALEASLKSADSIGNEYLKLSIYIELGQRSANGRKPQYFKQGLQEATAYHFSGFRAVFAENLYNFYRAEHNTEESIKYANIMLDAQQRQMEGLHKYGLSVVSYVQKDKDLKAMQSEERTQDLLIAVFIGLLIMALALLFFVWRANRISRRYAGIQRKLAEASRNRNRELENWNKFYDMLLSVLAHDLRQPFSAIIMTVQMLEFTDKELSEENLRTIMFDLNDTASKSIELLDGLLYWVKSKKKDFEYKTQPVYLHDNINEANGLYAYDQTNRGIQLINEIPEPLMINAHKQMLLFINRNLISNATKYSPTGGTIRVYAEKRGTETIVGFADQGQGMTPEQAEKLFKINDHPQSQTDLMKGAGIALSICFDMIRQMNGRLWVETEKGKGTAFFYAFASMDQ